MGVPSGMRQKSAVHFGGVEMDSDDMVLEGCCVNSGLSGRGAWVCLKSNQHEDSETVWSARGGVVSAQFVMFVHLRHFKLH